MSMIQQCRGAYVIGYSFLAAYRFLPAFSDELKKIALAKEMRGEGIGHTFLSALKNSPSYLIPLLASAMRKGERIALAIDSRGFRAYKDRSYYERLTIKKKIMLSFLHLFAVIIFITIILFITINFEGLGFNLGLKGGK